MGAWVQVVCPSTFDSFKTFVWWRGTVTSAVWHLCAQATHTDAPSRKYAFVQVVRPSGFDSFKNFVWWRETVTSAVWLILSQATRDHWVTSPGSAQQGLPSARSLLARRVQALGLAGAGIEGLDACCGSGLGAGWGRMRWVGVARARACLPVCVSGGVGWCNKDVVRQWVVQAATRT